MKNTTNHKHGVGLKIEMREKINKWGQFKNNSRDY